MIAKNTADAFQLVYKGAHFIQSGDPQNAEKSWRQAVETDPTCFVAWSFLTDFLAVNKRTPEALDCLSQLIATSNLVAANIMTCGEKSAFLELYPQARQLTEQALGFDPGLKQRAELLLAQIDYIEENWDSAIKRLTGILHAQPDHMEALTLRRKCWIITLRLEEEIADTYRLLELKPDVDMHGALLFKLNQAAGTTPEKLYEETLRWNQLYAAPLAAKARPHANKPDPERRLKIGYVSPDLKQHTIMKLLPAVFEKYDRAQFEVFAYSIATKMDQATELVKEHVDHFVDLPHSHEEIAARARADGIDILIDLAGHTTTEPLLAFAMKPAPVQATWIGMLSTTGLAAMDYFIGDQHMPCRGTEHLYTERIYRLPRVHCCYRPSGEIEIVRPPYFTNGHITFGCYNNQRKINRDVVKVWSVILHMNPGSQLILKCVDLERPVNQRPLREWLTEGGISLDRIQFEGRSANLDYLSAWNKVDIALDPFPYNGGTTTLDALWMGVPVVSIAGRLAVASAGADILATAGMPVASTLEQYVSIAGMLAQAIPATPQMRHQVHNAFKNSAYLDEPGLMRVVEKAYREMWRNWCLTQ